MVKNAHLLTARAVGGVNRIALDELVWLALPMLGMVALVIIMSKRQEAFTKKGLIIGAIIGTSVILVYYFLRPYIFG